ncbi:MAG: alanine--tRNA ligase [Limnochordales bacterium]|nr:alanine--tRNA ligase [Limnochordales bacterium]
MPTLSGNELREKYLRFFQGKDHLRLPSAPLIPENDPTLLFVGAGMVPFKPYFLGKARPPHTRLTTCQRCLRTADIDQVGHTARHATFFEMLGNFSFGDYFKEEAITWAWEFVTEILSLPKDRLWVTVYQDDDEAAAYWQRIAGLPNERIVRLGKEDNFWEIGVGPCGPCSEIYLDRGPGKGCGRPDCKPGCGCDRFLEFWNLVFIQFFKNEAGEYLPLERKGIDTGMGLERMSALLQGVESIFDVDLVRPILDQVAKIAGVRYGEDKNKDVSLRVVTDHLRGATFLAADGVLPGNEGRGYVLRRLIRRAIRHGRRLGIDKPFLDTVAATIISVMAGAYPELNANSARIKEVLRAEEARFRATLDQGTQLLEQVLHRLKSQGRTVLPGEDAFRLYDTYGFPFELTLEMATEAGFTVDRAGFEAAMERQRERARATRGETSYLGGEEDAWAHLAGRYSSRFVGYEMLSAAGRVAALARNGELVDQLQAGEEGQVVLDVTPFYAEAGGQVADTGTITGARGQFVVSQVYRPAGGLIVHSGKMVSGRLAVGDEVLASVDSQERGDTARNHTATHLLHKALRVVLGDHVRQAGSLVAPDRLRFDFSHNRPLTREELEAIEDLVNIQVMADIPVTTEVLPLEEALKTGAMALFGEKYGEEVRVVSVGDFSRELCGGTHVQRTGEIGLFKIVGEESTGAGVRRVEAVTGRAALRLVAQRFAILDRLAGLLETRVDEVAGRVERLLEQWRELSRERQVLLDKLAEKTADELAMKAREFDGLKLLATTVRGFDADALLALTDRLQNRLGEAVLLLASVDGQQAHLVARVSRALAAAGLDAGRLVREIAEAAGGRGGGRRELGRGAARDIHALPGVLTRVAEKVAAQLSSLNASRPSR